MKTLINPWKGLKPIAVVECHGCDVRENPNKSLEGIKTIKSIKFLPKLGGENPNKSLEGIKTLEFLRECEVWGFVKTLINPWKGLKPGLGFV